MEQEIEGKESVLVFVYSFSASLFFLSELIVEFRHNQHVVTKRIAIT